MRLSGALPDAKDELDGPDVVRCSTPRGTASLVLTWGFLPLLAAGCGSQLAGSADAGAAANVGRGGEG
jgi:hypothetical protein